nr:MAG: amino acid dehydrogenase [Sphaerobacter thermophilus]
MKTIVIGGGVVGVTTAYYLAREGHEVTVLEKLNDVGQDASGGNAGLIAPGHSFAWASPAAPKMLLKSLMGEATAIRLKLRPDPRLIWWGLQFLRECTSERARINTLIKMQLCAYSQKELDKLAAEESIDYHQVQRGAFYLYREERELELGMAKMELLRSHGMEMELVSAEELAQHDPAFTSAKGIVAGAIRCTTDASGNCEKFTKTLAERCRKLGVEFRFNTTAKRLLKSGNRVTGVETDQGTFVADNFVLANGIYSPHLSRTVGQRLPIYPAKGYSITVPIADPKAAPTVPGVDEKTLVAWSRMGDHLRMSSTAEFSGYSRTWKHSDLSNILRTGRELFPNAANWDEVSARACLRPMTPDGPPIIGRGKHENLYYNTGHGHMGWTMACGSSRVLVDLMMGRRPAIDTTGMHVRSIRR